MHSIPHAPDSETQEGRKRHLNTTHTPGNSLGPPDGSLPRNRGKTTTHENLLFFEHTQSPPALPSLYSNFSPHLEALDQVSLLEVFEALHLRHRGRVAWKKKQDPLSSFAGVIHFISNPPCSSLPLL